jgi:hypothetical protein
LHRFCADSPEQFVTAFIANFPERAWELFLLGVVHRAGFPLVKPGPMR